MLDQRDHPADQIGAFGVALQAANLVEDPSVAHHREPRPVAKVGEIAAWDLEYLVERAIMAALAKQRQYEPVDDAIIEAVARKSVGWGKRVSVRVDFGGRRRIK